MQRQNVYFSKKQQGLTVIELMVDLLLSIFVIGVLAGIYTNYKKNYNIQFDDAIIHQNALAVFKYIKNDIQLTGFFGCDSTSGNIEYAMTPTVDYILTNPISAYDANNTGLGSLLNLATPTANWSPSFAGQVTAVSPDAGSDVLTIRYANTNPSGVLLGMSNGSTLVTAAAPVNIAKNDILLISDCLRTVVFQVANIAGNTITPTQSVGNISAMGEIYKINIHSYYIKTVDGVPTLYRYSKNTEEPLVPNIENMQVLYGQDTTNDSVTDKFNTASNMQNYKITSLEIGILVRSNNKHGQSIFTNSYELLSSGSPFNTTITINTKNDKYFRKAFDFTLAIPNAIKS